MEFHYKENNLESKRNHALMYKSIPATRSGVTFDFEPVQMQPERD